jgi:hypothetical protein
MTIWQIAAGERGRDYSSLCIRHDLVLIGPGDPGPYKLETYANLRMGPQIRQFCEEPATGDIVLLRLWHEVVAVGVIPDGEASKSTWMEEFDDVLGWDLQHVRRVIWGDVSALAILEDMQPVFKNYKQQRTIHRVNEKRILERADKMRVATQSRPLRALPKVGKRLKDNDLGIALFGAGLANDTVEDVIGAIRKIERLAKWYEEGKRGARPNEHEIVAHAVVPLLLGLGWSEQLLGVEWKRIDVAMFDRLPAEEKNCVAVCEAKTLGSSSLSDAYQQAKRNIKRLKLTSCKVILTTDGKLLFAYRRQKGVWPEPEQPTGYINFCKIKAAYAIPEGRSGVDTLVSLLPARIHHEVS